jgi:hypothetical protein
VLTCVVPAGYGSQPLLFVQGLQLAFLRVC